MPDIDEQLRQRPDEREVKIYRCQFCEAYSPLAKWVGDICPKCGEKYDCILAQEGDD